jgi:hypothetical protein
MFKSKDKILIIVFCVLIAASAVVSIAAYMGGTDDADKVNDADETNGAYARETIPGLTIIKAPDQTQATRPDGFPDPEENWIKLPEGDNLAEGKSVDAGEHTEVFAAENAVDGDLNSYWESKGVPADITIDLASVYDIQTVIVRLNPVPIWEARIQSFEILISTDGTLFNTVAADERYEFDPDTGNLARVDFDTVSAQFVRLSFSSNSSGRSNGAQAAEIMVFE